MYNITTIFFFIIIMSLNFIADNETNLIMEGRTTSAKEENLKLNKRIKSLEKRLDLEYDEDRTREVPAHHYEYCEENVCR